LLFWWAGPAFGVVLHPDEGEPNLVTWTDRPDINVVGRWGSNASCVAVSSNCVITVRHAGGGIDTSVYFDDIEYKVKEIWNEPAGGGSADLRVCRIERASGGPANLVHYTSPYIDANEIAKEIRIGGYGDGRDGLLQTHGKTYGYTWDNSSNTTLRWGTNKINDTQDDSTIGSFTSDVIIADFDGLGEGNSTVYEAAVADHDSGNGLFIKVGDTWKVAGLSRAVEHFGESWFRNSRFPNQLDPDEMDAVRISSYATWISGIILVPGDLTGDDWVDSADFAVFASQWPRDDCGEGNNWCEGADFEPSDGDVDWDDLAFLVDNWLTGWRY
jgi:hypothetical protein